MAEVGKDSVRIRFQSDIEWLAESLIATFGLKYSRAEKHLSWALGRWMDFRLRYVDPCPRHVLYSDRFQRTFPIDVARAIRHIEFKFRAGENVNPHQSKGISGNDYSGKRHERRTDLLWADWNILHFHLTEKSAEPGEFFVPRSGHHLLAIVERDVVLFIDAVPHLKGAGYADLEMLKTVERCWPDYLARYEIKGVLPDKNRTDVEHYELRRNGVGTFVCIDGKAYMGPGRGVTTAVTSLSVGMTADSVLDAVDELADMVCDPADQFLKKVSDHGVTSPEFNLILYAQELAVFEKKSDHAFTIPRGTGSWLSKLHDTFYPQWAADVTASVRPAP